MSAAAALVGRALSATKDNATSQKIINILISFYILAVYFAPTGTHGYTVIANILDSLGAHGVAHWLTAALDHATHSPQTLHTIEIAASLLCLAALLLAARLAHKMANFPGQHSYAMTLAMAVGHDFLAWGMIRTLILTALVTIGMTILIGHPDLGWERRAQYGFLHGLVGPVAAALGAPIALLMLLSVRTGTPPAHVYITGISPTTHLKTTPDQAHEPDRPSPRA